MTDRKMSGAELKVQLTGLGLTPAWLAEHLNVASRTVLRWLDLDSIPTKAVAVIEDVSKVTDIEIEKITRSAQIDGVIRTRRTDNEGDVAECNTPLPAIWHRHLAFRVLDTLRSKDVPVTVAYADAQ